MMKLKALCVLAILALAGMGAVQAQDAGSSGSQGAASSSSSKFDGRWYLAPTLGGYYNDTARNTNSRQLYYGLGFGKFINSYTSVDLFTDYTNRTVDYGGGHWNSIAVGVAARFYAGAWDAWRPYAMVGAMGIHHHNRMNSGWAPGLQVGVGLSKTLNDDMDLRIETGYRQDYDGSSQVNNSYGDYFLGLSLVSRFGAAAAPPPPPPPKPVAPPPPPKPSCSQLDSDHDGVDNCDDKCPNTPPGTIVGPDGCPQKVVIDLRGVNFKFDRPHKGETNIAATLQAPSSDGMALLSQAVDTLKRYPNVHVMVAGYTDSRGSAAYNQKLSERRAKIVYDYLVAHGVSASQLDGPVGHGENDPVASNKTKDGRARNRRTELQTENN